jgi:nicotinamidase/pyrazinamidase
MVTINNQTDVLLVIDVQNDFMPGGALAVPEGNQVIPIINRLLKTHFVHAVATQDWHPPNHRSFASQHSGKAAFESIQLSYGQQTLWPDHCVQGTSGAALCDDLDTAHVQSIIRKGFRHDIDSYSAFLENDRKTSTGLQGYLQARTIKRVFVTGLARGLCTDFTAADAMEAGYETFLIEDACRGITPEETHKQTVRLQSLGVRFIMSEDIPTSG